MKKFLKIFIFFIFIGDFMSANSLPNYYTKNLDNGLQIVAIPMDNNTNVVSVDIFYKVGSRNEVMGKSGIAHMLEHLNFKSTKNLKSGEFDEIVKGFGGVNNAGTSFDYTHYYIKTASKNTDKSLELFSELMQNLTLKNEEFQPERDVVAEERRWRTDNNPMGYLQFRLFNNSYVYHPYHWTPIGFMDDIKNWTIEDIKDFHSTYYQPKNAIVVVAGDIKKEDVFSLVEKHFKDIKNTKDIPSSIHTVEPVQDGERRATVNKESNVEMLAMTYHIPNFEHEDQVALSALSQLLSSGKSSILQKVLVDEKRLANSVYAYNMELKDPGVFIFMAVANENIDALKIEKEILDIISRIQKGEVKEKDIDKLKINTKADFIYSLESSSDVASLFGTYLVRDNIKPLLDYEANLDKLKVEDIVNVAKKYLIKENSTTLILKEKN
ncbi:insulinase family protein [Aliarcobacter cibarius]|uniref:Insulinase family protein n=2 Tax=Aliarcobacter cibarius TaxID=255507 RepID=A0A5J6RHR5_9BACT|nr:zinc-dependent peptidase, M16 family [Aliarcobacter cibarius]QKJ27463.1 zinc-dependent peptidase, M16 family [Aliarcobacter cibarius]TLS99290.1 insulinase family protein [Aliarcobacter cibarius]TLT00433.1 insulinase family protein [Aliarcobacter cibarius]TLT04353.1 insulinase family protein [Aliarcobacter cibarius]